VEHSVTEEAMGPTESEPRTGVITAAEQLAAARERRGMGKGEVAQRLKLHPRQLEAIERGDWSALPGRAFVRGCVRSYGRLLGVDVEPLLQSIGGFAEAEELKPSATLAAPMPRSGGFGFDGEGGRTKLPWAILGVIGVIAVALFFGREGEVSKVSSWIGSAESPGRPGAPGPGPEAGTPASAGAPAGAATGTPLVPPPLVPAPAGPGAPGGTGATAAPGPASAAAPAPPPAPAAPPAPPPPPIRLSVKQDSWVDVRQADGKSIFMGTIKPAAPLELKGEAPYALTIGNASAVTLEFEGKPIDLKPVTSSPNNIAKVKLP
jgi:cytoskeleton protein RodZ